MIQLAQSKGYDNVAAYLKALQSKKGTDEFDEEEDEEVMEGDDEDNVQVDGGQDYHHQVDRGKVRLLLPLRPAGGGAQESVQDQELL